MTQNASDTSGNESTTDVVGNAVGVSGSQGNRRWYVAIVKHNTEIISAKRLAALGYESFAATQAEIRVWANGRRKKVDRVVIPSRLFVYCTEPERRQIVNFPFILRFMTNKAATPAAEGFHHPLAVIPTPQIERLRFMLGASGHPVEFTDYKKGDKVKVVRGPLRGLEGEVLRSADGTATLIISLDLLGAARTLIDPADLLPAS